MYQGLACSEAALISEKVEVEGVNNKGQDGMQRITKIDQAEQPDSQKSECTVLRRLALASLKGCQLIAVAICGSWSTWTGSPVSNPEMGIETRFQRGAARA
ncbi:hypothetical protein PG985_009194 [Apiospora marii]|uniref:Uncharacterized protein n=1 Tax=Apiospora marii TaxID=335849 RepID=A0ABR1RAB7_9PEZI